MTADDDFNDPASADTTNDPHSRAAEDRVAAHKAEADRVRSLWSQEAAALEARVAALVGALRSIEAWDMPPTPDGKSYAWHWGSNGERRYIRKVAREALAAAEPPTREQHVDRVLAEFDALTADVTATVIGEPPSAQAPRDTPLGAESTIETHAFFDSIDTSTIVAQAGDPPDHLLTELRRFADDLRDPMKCMPRTSESISRRLGALCDWFAAHPEADQEEIERLRDLNLFSIAQEEDWLAWSHELADLVGVQAPARVVGVMYHVADYVAELRESICAGVKKSVGLADVMRTALEAVQAEVRRSLVTNEMDDWKDTLRSVDDLIDTTIESIDEVDKKEPP